MNRFDDDNRGMRFYRLENRLETPDMVGYRAGMSSAGVIACKLGRMYRPSQEAPQEIQELATIIDRELGFSR